jgi:hypothetical protein
MALTPTHWLISARCLLMAAMLTWHAQRGAAAARADGAEQVTLRRPFQQASPAGTFGRLRPGKPPVALDPRVPRLAKMRVSVR